jgi:glutathione S-transferase
MKIRHYELADEMLRRGYIHKSHYSLPDLRYLPYWYRYALVDRNKSIEDLKARCPECKEGIENYEN